MPPKFSNSTCNSPQNSRPLKTNTIRRWGETIRLHHADAGRSLDVYYVDTTAARHRSAGMGWAESGGGKWMFGPWMCGKCWKTSFLMFSYPMDKEWFVFGELLICFCWCAFALGNDVGVLLGTVECWITDDDACFQPDIANVITFGGMLWTNPSFNYIFVVEWLGNSISMRFESLAPYTNGNICILNMKPISRRLIWR